MVVDDSAPWRVLARSQEGILSRTQLRRCGVNSDHVRSQVRAERWQLPTPIVIATTTGVLTRRQLMWVGVLHGGPRAAVGGLTALELHGLRNWHRDRVRIMVPKSEGIEPVPGIEFVETRRDTARMLGHLNLPTWRTEPASLLFAAYEPVTRTAYGLLTAVVQQRLTSPERLETWINAMRPLRRARAFRRLLGDIAGGSQSLAEIDLMRMCRQHGLPAPVRQARRRDASGRLRYTDAEWALPDGRVLVLEVDGAFHMDVGHWEEDIERERALVATGRMVVRCTAREARERPEKVVRDLRRLGLGRLSA